MQSRFETLDEAFTHKDAENPAPGRWLVGCPQRMLVRLETHEASTHKDAENPAPGQKEGTRTPMHAGTKTSLPSSGAQATCRGTHSSI